MLLCCCPRQSRYNLDAEYTPKVGDYVQWEPGGTLQFKEPKRIQRFSWGGRFAFVEGSATGLPVRDLTKEAQPAAAPPPIRNTPNSASPKANMREDVFSLAKEM